MNREAWMQTEHYRSLREACMKKSGNRCVLCAGPAEVMHHNNYPGCGNEILDDVVMLCGECHARYHGKERNMNLHDLTYENKATDLIPGATYHGKIINVCNEENNKRIRLIVEMSEPGYEEVELKYYISYKNGNLYLNQFCDNFARQHMFTSPRELFKQIVHTDGSCLENTDIAFVVGDPNPDYPTPLIKSLAR